MKGMDMRTINASYTSQVLLDQNQNTSSSAAELYM